MSTYVGASLVRLITDPNEKIAEHMKWVSIRYLVASTQNKEPVVMRSFKDYFLRVADNHMDVSFCNILGWGDIPK
jgi:hypothetical protein